MVGGEGRDQLQTFYDRARGTWYFYLKFILYTGSDPHKIVEANVSFHGKSDDKQTKLLSLPSLMSMSFVVVSSETCVSPERTTEAERGGGGVGEFDFPICYVKQGSLVCKLN